MEKIEIKRCAVYVRKSTEQGLEQQYNSLDAQRDSALAYIKSQEANGWQFTKEYRDGGFSGGNINRPALHELIADIKADKVDLVIVYKIDRLSRSLADFAKLHNLFESHNVGFISVTQQLDTSNATGRMMMNILCSFAQFEREMLRDRVRDKLHASLKIGLFMGGRVPFGYNVKDHKLVPNKHADLIKDIYRRFMRSRSAERMAAYLNGLGIKRDPGKKWTAGMVKTLLKDPRYMGKNRCAGELYEGKHPALIDVDTWERAQEILNRRKRKPKKATDKKPKGPHPLLRVIKFGHGVLSMLDAQKAARAQEISETLDPKPAEQLPELHL